MTGPGSVFRLFAALAGLLLLWAGCSLTNAPVRLGGPMNLSFNAPLGIPLVALGVAVVAFAPPQAWRPVWLLAAALALATAGANFWRFVPIEDGAFQALRSGMPDPDRSPAAPFLHVVALSPVGVALAALLPGPRHVAPLLLASTAAVPVAGLALEHFEVAQVASYAIPAAASLALATARGGNPAGRAVAGQAAVLLVLCLLLWLEWGRVV